MDDRSRPANHGPEVCEAGTVRWRAQGILMYPRLANRTLRQPGSKLLCEST